MLVADTLLFRDARMGLDALAPVPANILAVAEGSHVLGAHPHIEHVSHHRQDPQTASLLRGIPLELWRQGEWGLDEGQQVDEHAFGPAQFHQIHDRQLHRDNDHAPSLDLIASRASPHCIRSIIFYKTKEAHLKDPF